MILQHCYFNRINKKYTVGKIASNETKQKPPLPSKKLPLNVTFPDDIHWLQAAGFMCALSTDRPGFVVGCAISRPKLILYVNARGYARVRTCLGN